MITLAEAKLHLRLVDDLASAADYTAEDELIQALIDAAYRHAEQRTRVTFEQRSRTLALDGFPDGDTPIELPWTPVVSVDSVTYTDPDDAAQTLTGFYLDTREAYATLAPEHGSDWPATRDVPESVTLTATAGEATTPPDVRAALLLLIGHWYENREAVVIGSAASELPAAVDALLGPYQHYNV